MDLRIALIPVGKVDAAEVEGAAARLAKILNKAIELREPAPIPKAGDDPARGQHLAAPFLAELRTGLKRLAVKKLVGAAPAAAHVSAGTPDAAIFVTDVDIFRPQTEGVFAEVDPAGHAAVISLRRLREAFYRRKADPGKQRSRLVKLSLYALGRARGLPECKDPGCALFTTTALADVDMKPEKFCASCWRRLTTGAYRI